MAARNTCARATSVIRSVCLRRQNLVTKASPQISMSRSIGFSSTMRDRYFSKDHEWIEVDGTTAKVGISHYAQEKLGELVFVELPEVDDEFHQDDVAGTVESVKAASDVVTPVSGKIVGVNEELVKSPSLINSAAEDDGWIFSIELTDPKELESLMDGDKYKSFCEEEEED